MEAAIAERPMSLRHDRAFQDGAAFEHREHFAKLAERTPIVDDSSRTGLSIAQELEGLLDVARAEMKGREQGEVVVVHPARIDTQSRAGQHIRRRRPPGRRGARVKTLPARR